MGKGSSRRPGEGYGDGFDRIFSAKAGEPSPPMRGTDSQHDASDYILSEHEVDAIMRKWQHESNSRYELCRAVESEVLSRCRAQGGNDELADYRKIAHLIGSIFFAGDFKAETANERELETLLVKTGHLYSSWDEIASAGEKP